MRNRGASRRIREDAIRLLGRMGIQAPVEELIEILQDQTDIFSVRVAVARVLGTLEPSLVLKPLLLAAQDDNGGMRMTVLEILGTRYTRSCRSNIGQIG